MRKNWLPSAVGLGDDGLGQYQRHDQDAVPFDGTRKNLDSICAVVNLLAHSLHRLRAGFDIGNADVVGLKKSLHVNGRPAFCPERLANGQNLWPFYFTAFYASA